MTDDEIDAIAMNASPLKGFVATWDRRALIRAGIAAERARLMPVIEAADGVRRLHPWGINAHECVQYDAARSALKE